MCLEASFLGHGDIREPFAELVKPSGSRSADFRYDNFEILDSKPFPEALPSAYDCGECLKLTLRDGDLTLELYYGVFLRRGVIRLLSDLPHIGVLHLLFWTLNGVRRFFRFKMRFMVKRISILRLPLSFVILDCLTAHELLRGRFRR